MTLKVVWLYIGVLGVTGNFITGPQCGECDMTKCPSIGDCPQGFTLDACRCCETCIKTVGEECGGLWEAYGKCGPRMVCFKDARECPYLYEYHQNSDARNSDICKMFLVNAKGRCVVDTNVLAKSNLKRFGFLERMEKARNLHRNSVGANWTKKWTYDPAVANDIVLPSSARGRIYPRRG